MELEDLCDSLSSQIFAEIEWPVSHTMTTYLLGILDFERTGKTQNTLMELFGEGVFTRFDVKEKLLQALYE
jgi:hypothetical protein